LTRQAFGIGAASQLGVAQRLEAEGVHVGGIDSERFLRKGDCLLVLVARPPCLSEFHEGVAQVAVGNRFPRARRYASHWLSAALAQ
jgi:hypothetical protein